jgi:hypothetical protein
LGYFHPKGLSLALVLVDKQLRLRTHANRQILVS